MKHRHRHDHFGDFEAWSQSYDSSVLQRLFFERLHRRVVRELSPLLRGAAAPVVVDVGCGTGRLLEQLRATFPSASLIGVDAAAGMIDVASRKPSLAGVRLSVGGVEALPFEDASCDVVVSTVSFHHWHDQGSGLREVARVLRPGGRVLLVDAWARGPYAPLMRRLWRRHGVGFRSEAEAVGMLHGAGLRLQELLRIGPPGSPLGMAKAARP